MRRFVVAGLATASAALLATLCFGASVSAGQQSGAGLYPDLQTVVPKHLSLQNEHQREMLRFSNGIANLGDGDWRMRAETVPTDTSVVTNAIQEILDANGNVVREEVVSTMSYHETHHHWHMGGVALFELHYAEDNGTGGVWGPVYMNDRGVAQSVKTTFCLIDWYKLEDNAPTKERKYFDCYGQYQGIQPGWVDQYHQATDGQELDMTGAPEGVYYLVSTANADGNYLESNLANNTAWVSFYLSRGHGNSAITLIGQSECSSPSMCGDQKVNR